MKKSDSSEPVRDIDAWFARLKTIIATFDAMDSENERRSTLYYLIASRYGNDIGDRFLRLLD